MLFASKQKFVTQRGTAILCSRFRSTSWIPPQKPNSLKFFNREEEIKLLSNALSVSPALNLVTGPINSGKSWLMQHVLDNLKQREVPPAILQLNMRRMPFVDVQSFLRSFNANLQTWFSNVWNILKTVKVQLRDVTVQLENNPLQLTDVFQLISEALPDWSVWHGKNIPIPILFIDEVNLLRDLTLRDPNGQSIIKSIFTWFINVTKEERKFHVVLASSDSFVHNWLTTLVGNDRFEAFVVGHLSKNEAKEYWDKQVASRGFYGRAKISFEEVYDICGGSMFLLLQLYHNYVTSGLHPSKSFYIYQARINLIKALSPDNSFYCDPLKSIPKWKRDDLVKVVHLLANAEGNYVYYDDLIHEIGQNVIDSLIEYNVIHLRPFFPLVKDLNPVPTVSRAVVTAESQVGLYVMKELKKTMLSKQ